VRAGSLPAWLAATTVFVATLAHADYKDNYALGLKAYNDGEFVKARDLMQQALAEHAEPATRIRLYGQRWEAYLPQYYLGMIAFKQGDCATALTQWNAPASRQVVAQLSEINSAQQRDAATCEQKTLVKNPDVPKQTTAPEPPPAKIAIAEVPAPKPIVAKPADITPAPAPPPAKRVEVATAKPPPVVAAPVIPPPASKPAASSNMPPVLLEEAFENYLAGRYAKVVRINPEAITDTRARFHAYMVRAAARFTLAQISNDNGELDGARADARAAHALDGRGAPDAALFSPRFRTFFLESH